MLHSSVVGQNLNLTSCSFRAFRFAKRCPGGRGGAVPLLGWFLRRFPPIPRGRGRGRSAARRLAWVVNWAFRRGRRPRRPEPPSIVKRTDSHVQCAHWPRNDRKRLSLRGAKRRGNPHPPSPRLPCGKGDVCERRQWRKKRAKRSGSGQNSVGVCEQRILGTVTDVQIPFWNLIDGGHALGTTGAVTASP